MTTRRIAIKSPTLVMSPTYPRALVVAVTCDTTYDHAAIYSTGLTEEDDYRQWLREDHESDLNDIADTLELAVVGWHKTTCGFDFYVYPTTALRDTVIKELTNDHRT